MQIQNGTIYRSNPMRYMFGVGIINDTRVPMTKYSSLMNRASIFGNLAAIPEGYYLGTAFIAPTKSGALSSVNSTWITLTPTGNGARGLSKTGTTTITISATALGQLIASAIGTTSFEITSTGDIVATIGAPGTASITITASAIKDALGWLTSSASMNIITTLTAYAVGHMEGTTDVNPVLTAERIAMEVWNSIASEFDEAGSMGYKLNGAASAGDPWTTDLPGSYPEGSAGYIVAIIAKLLRNKMVTDPNTGIMTVYDDNGNVLFTGQLYEDVSGTQPYRGQGSERRERLE